MLSAMVIGAVALYLILATRILYSDKTLLIYELNQSNVRILASDIEANFKRISDKLRLIGSLPLANIDALTENDDEIVTIHILKNTGEVLFHRVFPAYLELSGRTENDFATVRQNSPINVGEILQTPGVWVKNSSLPATRGAQPLYLVSVALRDNQNERVIHADLRLDRILSNYQKSGIAETYLIDSQGTLLAHADAARVAAREKVAAQVDPKLSSETKQFQENGKSYLGSFAKVGIGGLIVVSKTQLEEAFLAASTLMKKSALYAALVITAAFLVALFFSHSLTEPIRMLVDATKRIAEGDFERLVTVKSHDELSVLATSFNSMTSNLKSSRQQIQEYSQGLEKKVAERTAKLEEQNVAIKNAQEALVRTTRLASVGEIAGRAAHEVLNPLTSMTARLEKIRTQGLIEDEADLRLLIEIVNAWSKDFGEKGPQGLFDALMTKTTPGPDGKSRSLLEEDIFNLKAVADDLEKRINERKTDIDFLSGEADRISKIVNGMRGLTRVSGNRRQIDVHEFLNDCLKTMADLFSKEGIKGETKFCKAKPTILADRDEMLQVMTNLMRNSLQAIREARRAKKTIGSPALVRLSTELVTVGDEKRVIIRISDNGPGIPKQHIGDIFEPTFTTKSPEEGTGLGLSISRRFVRAYDGELSLEKSVAGLETTFLIEMPDATGRKT